MDVILDMEIVRTVLASVGALFGLGLGGYAAVKRAKVAGGQAVAEEWRELAEARESKIADLEKRQNDLENRLAHLEGAYSALQDLKVSQIADRVVERLAVVNQVQANG